MSPELTLRRGAVSVRLTAGKPVALVDPERAERPGVDQVQRHVLGDRWQERRAATDDDRIAEHAPRTLSSVRLKTTFGIADQASANAAPSSLSRSDGSVSHTSMVS